jgi:hypothetical protein
MVCLSHLECENLLFGWQLTPGRSVGAEDLWADDCIGFTVINFELERIKNEMTTTYLKLLC